MSIIEIKESSEIMGFFFTDAAKKKKKTPKEQLNDMLVKTYGCNICPRKDLNIDSPKMEPTGADKPVYYFVGESPGRDEDEQGKQFVGQAGSVLREQINKCITPSDRETSIRWNNVVRCYHENITPSALEIDCCKTSVIEDIEKTKPLLVVGFGGIPLKAFLDGKMITLWRGRLIPMKFGSHTCWYFPTLHPSYVLRNRAKGYKTEIDDVFERDINWIFTNFVEEYEPPVVIDSGYKDDILTMNVLAGIIDEIHAMYGSELLALDLETTTLRPYERDAEIWSVALSSGKKTISFPLEYKRFFSEEQVSLLKRELELLFYSVKGIVAHNLKFELEWLLALFGNQNFMRVATWHDTMTQAYLLDERTSKTEGMLNLDRLTQLNFGFNIKSLTGVDNKSLKSSSIEDILLYNAIDAKYTHKLFLQQQKKLLDISLQICYNNLIETAKTLTLTQAYGLEVDTHQLNLLDVSYNEQLKSILRNIQDTPEIKKYMEVYGEFNPLSYPCVVKLLQDIMGIPVKKKTKEGNYSVDDSVLTELAEGGTTIAQYILDYRGLIKLRSTYLLTVSDTMVDGVIHPNYNLLYTVTGRLSSGASTEE